MNQPSSEPPICAFTLFSTAAHCRLAYWGVTLAYWISCAIAYRVGSSDTGSPGLQVPVTTLAMLWPLLSLHTHLAMGISTNMLMPSACRSPVSSAAAAHWWYSSVAHGLSTPKMSRSPAQPIRFLAVIVASNSPCRS